MMYIYIYIYTYRYIYLCALVCWGLLWGSPTPALQISAVERMIENQAKMIPGFVHDDLHLSRGNMTPEFGLRGFMAGKF